MASLTTMSTYDLKGNKLSFANWISNLSPRETPFVSMTGKEAISQPKFNWQTDILPAVDKGNAQVEGSKPAEPTNLVTQMKSNNTQILRKVVQVSDTANVVAAYGRGKELQYQMEKAGAEIKRDLELAFLTQGAAVTGGSSTARQTAGFVGLCSGLNMADTDTGAIVHKKTNNASGFTEAQLFDLTYNMYMANSQANVIMFHPKWAPIFSGLMDKSITNRVKVFDGLEDSLNFEVDTIIDPLGHRWALVPNRLMVEDALYFFNPADWTQMVFRAPQRTKLAKEGSYEKWMIEMEVGLRHRNPYASGILEIKA